MLEEPINKWSLSAHERFVITQGRKLRYYLVSRRKESFNLHYAEEGPGIRTGIVMLRLLSQPQTAGVLGDSPPDRQWTQGPGDEDKISREMERQRQNSP